ncbi:MAG: polyprenyl synthetase family protein [bacterium]
MSNKELKNVINPINKELDNFNAEFEKSLKSKVGLVDLVTKYILRQKSKKIRPVLVLQSAKICGKINQRSFRGATLVELLHTATLVHDDVVDNAEERRGLPSINAIWKNKISVLMGDYLLARGLMIAVDGEDYDFLKVMTATVKRMSEGELLQISKTRKLDNDYETYYKIISDKTASLISTCCEIGSRSATDDPEKIEAMRVYGESLGMAFQIIDDILDYVGKKKLFGKPLGGDIKEKKITLPLLYAFQISTKDEIKEIIKIIKHIKSKNDIQKVIDFVVNKQGIEYSYKIAKEFAKSAKDALSVFGDCEAKLNLEYLVDFVIERNN